MGGLSDAVDAAALDIPGRVAARAKRDADVRAHVNGLLHSQGIMPPGTTPAAAAQVWVRARSYAHSSLHTQGIMLPGTAPLAAGRAWVHAGLSVGECCRSALPRLVACEFVEPCRKAAAVLASSLVTPSKP